MSKDINALTIRDYLLTKELTNEHSGFSKWGFAVKDGEEVFIKEFLSPIWPDEKSPLSKEQKEKKKAVCTEWMDRKSAVYEAIQQSANGNIIVPVDFFRHGSHYYLVTEKVNTHSLSIEQIADLEMDKKLLIVKVFAHCLNQLAKTGIVHSDLKPDNLLIKETVAGMCTLKLIDFDSSFLETALPPADEIQCDPTYMSPESFLYMIEEISEIDHRADIFSAGLIIHQYMCGELPKISDEYDYVYEAVLDEADVVIQDSIPKRIKNIIAMMLAKDSAERITSENLYQQILLTTLDNLWEDISTVADTDADDVAVSEDPVPVISEEELIPKKNVFRPSSDDEW